MYERCEAVTLKHVENRGERGRWPDSDQLNHIHSEVSEAYDVRRRPERYMDKPDAYFEELSDVILSTITLFNLNKVSADDFEEFIFDCIRKTEKRVGIEVE